LCSKWSEFKLVPRDYNVGLHVAAWIIPLMMLVALMLFICFKTSCLDFGLSGKKLKKILPIVFG